MCVYIVVNFGVLIFLDCLRLFCDELAELSVSLEFVVLYSIRRYVVILVLNCRRS